MALASIDIVERERLNDRVRSLEGDLRVRLQNLLHHPLAAEVRGMGYFFALEMDKDGEPLSHEERDWLMQSFLSRRIPQPGLICRLDNSEDPVITLAPPLISGPAEFDEITSMMERALDEAWEHLRRGKLEMEESLKNMPPATA